MFFKFFHKQHLALFLSFLMLITSLFYSIKSIGEDTDLALTAHTSQYSHQAWYVVEVGNVPIGTAVVSMETEKHGSPYEYVIQLTSRVGVSPIASEISVSAQSRTNNRQQITQKFLSKSQSFETNQPPQNRLLQKQDDTFITDKTNFFFDEQNSLSFQKVLSPFPTYFLKIEDNFTANYSRDNFLQSASIKINANTSIEFKRINEKKYHAALKKIFVQRLDIDDLNGLQSHEEEMDKLVNVLSTCQSEMLNLNRSILRQMPHESYLMNRRIINLNQFCSRLERKLTNNDDDNEEKLILISNQVKNLLKEDASELPHAVSQFSDRTLYYNNAMSFLWPRITTAMVQNAVNEISNLYRLDLNRKSLLGIQLKIAQMQQKAVVRANITQLSSPVRFFVQSNTDSKPYYINGISFANHSKQDLGDICQKNAGNIGMDLQDASQAIVSSTGIRGVWDMQTKLTTVRVFGIMAALEKSCHNIYFKSDLASVKFVQQEIDTLKNESLSLENTLLLSNYGQKKLWVMPGKYRITIASIINEKIISVQEFFVGENTQTNVVANVH